MADSNYGKYNVLLALKDISSNAGTLYAHPTVRVNTAGAVAPAGTSGDPVYTSSVSGAASLPSSFGAGQLKLNGSAQNMATLALVNGVIIKAKSSNAGKVFVGTSNAVTTTDDGTGNGYALAAGEAISIAVNNLNLVYVIGTNNDVVYYTGN
jgi:hypothetical protein